MDLIKKISCASPPGAALRRRAAAARAGRAAAGRAARAAAARAAAARRGRRAARRGWGAPAACAACPAPATPTRRTRRCGSRTGCSPRGPLAAPGGMDRTVLSPSHFYSFPRCPMPSISIEYSKFCSKLVCFLTPLKDVRSPSSNVIDSIVPNHLTTSSSFFFNNTLIPLSQ